MSKIAISILVYSCMFVSQLASQENDTVQLKLTDKFFEDNVSLDQLLGFKWQGKRLVLRRDWVAPEIEQEEPNLRALNLGDPERIQRRIRDQILRASQSTPLQYELSLVAEQLGSRGHGRSGGDDNMIIRYQCEQHSFWAQIEGENHYITFRQSTAPRQRFTLEESDDGRLKLMLDYRDGFVLVTQDMSGNVSVSVIADANATTYTATSFAEMYERQPNVIDKIFSVLLDHLKIGQPLSISSSEVKAFIKETLLASNQIAEQKEELKKIIAQLDSKKYKTRVAATDALSANYTKWKTELAELLTDESLPIESRMRIKNVIADSKEDNKRNNSVIEFVEANNLLQNNEFLFSIADENDQRLMNAIFNQIEKNDPELSLEAVKEKYENWKLR